MLLEADDGWCDRFEADAGECSVYFLANNGFSPFGLAGALLDVGVYDTGQIIHVVQEDAVNLVHSWVDIAGDCDIDEEHGAVTAQADDTLHVLAIEDEMGGSAGGDHDIDFRQGGDEFVVLDGLAVEHPGQFFGSIPGSVCNQNSAGPRPPQVFRGQFAHLARPDDHDGLALERTENLPRQFHRRVADGDGHLADSGFSADTLGHIEGTCHHRFQQTTDSAFGAGYRVGSL